MWVKGEVVFWIYGRRLPISGGWWWYRSWLSDQAVSFVFFFWCGLCNEERERARGREREWGCLFAVMVVFLAVVRWVAGRRLFPVWWREKISRGGVGERNVSEGEGEKNWCLFFFFCVCRESEEREWERSR